MAPRVENDRRLRAAQELLTSLGASQHRVPALLRVDAIFLVGLAASLSAGILQNTVGWQLLNLFLLPWLAVAASAIIWLGLSAKKEQALAPTR